MRQTVETLTPDGVMKPIGPYSHVARAGNLVMISATAGVDPDTNRLAGQDAGSQTEQILRSLERLLESAGSAWTHVLHINVFLRDMEDFDAMNEVYAAYLGDVRPARTAIAVRDLPKAGARLTMNLTAITVDG